MTSTARLYGGSLYELAAGEGLADVLLEQIGEVRKIFRQNPDYVIVVISHIVYSLELQRKLKKYIRQERKNWIMYLE